MLLYLNFGHKQIFDEVNISLRAETSNYTAALNTHLFLVESQVLLAAYLKFGSVVVHGLEMGVGFDGREQRAGKSRGLGRLRGLQQSWLEGGGTGMEVSL